MSPKGMKINILDLKRRNLLRFLGFTYPYWGVLCVAEIYGIFYSIGESSSAFNFVQSIAAYSAPFCLIAGYVFSYKLLFSQVEFTPDKVIFPGWLKKAYSSALLREIKCCSSKSKVLEFSFGSEESEIHIASLPIQRIDYADRIKILQFIEKNYPACKIDEQTYQILSNPEHIEFLAGKELQVPYNGHFRFKAFLQTFKQYERTFWTVWLGICIPAALFVTPLLVFGPLRLLFKYRDKGLAELDGLWNKWTDLWRLFFGDALTNFSGGMNLWSQWFGSNTLTAVCVSILTLVVFLSWLRKAFKPTGLAVSESQFILDYIRLGHWRFCKRIALKECKRVKVVQDERSVSRSRLSFVNAKGDEMASIELAGIDKQQHRNLIYKALECYAPHVELAPEFIESVQRNPLQNYTELWLQSLNTPPKRDRLSPLKSGDRLQGGVFRIIDIVGSGGQGIAYLSECTDNLGEALVVKEFMLPVFVDRRARQQAVERFENEVRLLSSIDHPNIVSLKGHFIEDHRAYLVLEHVRGQSLRKLFSENAVHDEKLLVQIAEQMAKILQYLHSLSPPLVHRDFTPDNLILDENGVLKLIDFNVAKQTDGRSKTAIVGKHAYMPPEQFAGKPSSQSDIYAFGATLYFCIKGEDPEPLSQLIIPETQVTGSGVWHDLIWKSTALQMGERLKSADEIIDLMNMNSDDSVTIDIKEAEHMNG